MRVSWAILTAVVVGLGCGDKEAPAEDSPEPDDGGDDGGGDNGGGGGDDGGPDTGGDTGEEPMVPATLTGTVRVQLYQDTPDGNREFISWEESGYGDSFPFGPIFVGAAWVGQSGALRDAGNTTILTPTPAGDTFELSVDLTNVQGEIHVYAALDYYQDGIIHSADPFGLWPQDFTLYPGDELGEINLTILVPYEDFGGLPAGESGPGDASGCTDITLSGPAEVTVPWDGGRAAAMLFTRDNEGPFNWSFFEPESTPEGTATGSWSFQTCADLGRVKLLAATDENANDLIDPADLWGGYAPTLDVSGNPLAVASTDLDDLRVQIPLIVDGEGLSVVPFATLSGTVRTGTGTFDDLPAGSRLLVTALKRRPNREFPEADLLADGYDWQIFEWSELQGRTSLDWALTVPSNTIVYLWAYADFDADGVYNEADEAIGSGGLDATGRLSTETGVSGRELVLGFAPSE